MRCLALVVLGEKLSTASLYFRQSPMALGHPTPTLPRAGEGWGGVRGEAHLYFTLQKF